MGGNAIGLTSILDQGHAVFLARTFTPVVDFLTVLAGTLAFLPGEARGLVLAEVEAPAAAARAVATARFLRLAAACSSASLRK